MKANQIRLGNWVYYKDDTIAVVSKISSIGDRISVCVGINQYNGIGKFSPIPLTVYLLQKFGFEFWGVKSVNEHEKYNRWVLYNVIDGTGNFEVHIVYTNYGGQNKIEIRYSIDDDEHQYIHQTEFVHNLQNAFYQCTGFELTGISDIFVK
jgi:hypothetical protein